MAEPLAITKGDQECGAFLLPPICCQSGAVHVSQELRAHGPMVFALLRQSYKGWKVMLINNRIEVSLLYVNEAYLAPVR